MNDKQKRAQLDELLAAISPASLIEALLFVSSEPLTVAAIAASLGLSGQEVEDALYGLQDELATRHRGLRLLRHGDSVQMTSAPQAAAVIERLTGAEAQSRMSDPALETLALVAYRQPVTRAGLEAVRGVDCGGVVNTLLARGLIEEVGRQESVGRPILYGTTAAFLRHFGLGGLHELPEL